MIASRVSSTSAAETVNEWKLGASTGAAVVGVALIVCVLFLLRLKLRYLFVFDSVNFALSLKDFNVLRHQPQAPGYPGFVLLAKLLSKGFPDPTELFFFIGVLATTTSALLMTLLGDAMATAKAGVAAAVLLIFNSANTSSVIISPVRNFLALTSVLVAWLVWLGWTRDNPRRYFFLSAAALGIFSSFRPELTVTLLPLLILVAVRRRLGVRDYLIAAAIYVIAILIWLYPTARPAGGIVPYFKFVRGFFASQAQIAAAGNGSNGRIAWLHMAKKASIWTFTGVLSWIWIVPFTWKRIRASREPGQTPVAGRDLLLFLAIWLVPGWLFSCFVHIAQAGQALASIAPVCLIGGLALAAVRRLWLFLPMLAVSAYLNIYTLKHPIISFDDASTASMKAMNRFSGPLLDELFTLRSFKHFFIVSDNAGLSWRTIHYYLPETPLLVLDNGITGSAATLFPGGDQVERVEKVAEIPACGTIAWLVSHTDEVREATAGLTVPDWHGKAYLSEGAAGMDVRLPGQVPIESNSRFCGDGGSATSSLPRPDLRPR